MKKLTLILIFALLLNTTAFGQEIKEPEVNALGAVLMDANTGRILWDKNGDDPLAMASTTKIMTAIVALENGNLNDTVKISSRAAAVPEVKMHLQTGEEIKLEFLMYALMLQSYNDSAIAIAEHIGGDVESFCKMMTDKAISLGAVDTIFETPNGLDAGDHHSTAADMAIITRYALQNEEFMKIINTPNVSVFSNQSGYDLYNKNRLLNEFEGANGVKTGFTGKAGQCFVGAAKRGDMQLISVVLGSGWGTLGKERKWIDTKQLLNYGFDNYKYVDIIKAEDICDDIDVTRSKTESLALKYEKGLTLALNEDEISRLRVEIDAEKSAAAPVEAGQIMGVCKISIGDEVIEEIRLITTNGAERHDFITSLKKVFSGFLSMGTNEEIEMNKFDFME